MKQFQFIFIAIIGLILAACSSTNIDQDPAAQYKNYSAQQLLQAGEKSLKKPNYNNAINYFEALNSLYPFTNEAERGSLGLIYAYYKSENYASCVAEATQFIRLYPRDPHVDYAYFMKAKAELAQNQTFYQKYLPIDMSYRDLSDAKQAFFDYRDLVQLFPNSVYANDAKQQMVILRNMFARHEIQIADYYFKRKAYVAAANRASYVIQNYQHTPYAKQALEILAKSNAALGVTQASQDASAVLAAN